MPKYLKQNWFIKINNSAQISVNHKMFNIQTGSETWNESWPQFKKYSYLIILNICWDNNKRLLWNLKYALSVKFFLKYKKVKNILL